MELDTEVGGTAAAPEVDTSTEAPSLEAPTTTPATESEYKPFLTGREKFKIDGKEVELDWKTAQRLIQQSQSSYSRFEQAAKIQKQARETYQKLLTAAQNDPEGLIRMFNPQFPGFPNGNTQAGAQATGQTSGVDPKDHKLSEYESKIQSLEEKFEAQEIEAERKAMETELDDALKEYPQLNNKFLRQYVKQQYLQALKSDLFDLTIQDIAFQVANEWDGLRAEERKAKQQKIDDNKRKAPLTTVPGKEGEKPMTRDQVLKLAGRLQ